MAKRTNSAVAQKTDEASVTEAAVVLRNAKAVRRDLLTQLEEKRTRAEELREQIAKSQQECDRLDGEVALVQSRLADLETDLVYARRTVQLTAGSEVEALSRRRLNELEQRRNDLLMDIATAEDVAAENKQLIERGLARAQAELAQLGDDEATLVAELEVIQQREAEAREQRGQEVLATLEADIAEAEAAYERANAEAGEQRHQLMLLRMGAKEKLAEFGLHADAERLSPHFARPASSEERVLMAFKAFLVELRQANDVHWDIAFGLSGNMRSTVSTLFGLLALPENTLNSYVFGADHERLAKHILAVENAVSTVRYEYGEKKGGRH